jgi:hypothetical protein
MSKKRSRNDNDTDTDNDNDNSITKNEEDNGDKDNDVSTKSHSDSDYGSDSDSDSQTDSGSNSDSDADSDSDSDSASDSDSQHDSDSDSDSNPPSKSNTKSKSKSKSDSKSNSKKEEYIDDGTKSHIQSKPTKKRVRSPMQKKKASPPSKKPKMTPKITNTKTPTVQKTITCFGFESDRSLLNDLNENDQKKSTLNFILIKLRTWCLWLHSAAKTSDLAEKEKENEIRETLTTHFATIDKKEINTMISGLLIESIQYDVFQSFGILNSTLWFSLSKKELKYDLHLKLTVLLCKFFEWPAMLNSFWLVELSLGSNLRLDPFLLKLAEEYFSNNINTNTNNTNNTLVNHYDAHHVYTRIIVRSRHITEKSYLPNTDLSDAYANTKFVNSIAPILKHQYDALLMSILDQKDVEDLIILGWKPSVKLVIFELLSITDQLSIKTNSYELTNELHLCRYASRILNNSELIRQIWNSTCEVVFPILWKQTCLTFDKEAAETETKLYRQPSSCRPFGFHKPMFTQTKQIRGCHIMNKLPSNFWFRENSYFASAKEELTKVTRDKKIDEFFKKWMKSDVSGSFKMPNIPPRNVQRFLSIVHKLPYILQRIIGTSMIDSSNYLDLFNNNSFGMGTQVWLYHSKQSNIDTNNTNAAQSPWNCVCSLRRIANSHLMVPSSSEFNKCKLFEQLINLPKHHPHDKEEEGEEVKSSNDYPFLFNKHIINNNSSTSTTNNKNLTGITGITGSSNTTPLTDQSTAPSIFTPWLQPQFCENSSITNLQQIQKKLIGQRNNLTVFFAPSTSTNNLSTSTPTTMDINTEKTSTFNSKSKSKSKSNRIISETLFCNGRPIAIAHALIVFYTHRVPATTIAVACNVMFQTPTKLPLSVIRSILSKISQLAIYHSNKIPISYTKKIQVDESKVKKQQIHSLLDNDPRSSDLNNVLRLMHFELEDYLFTLHNKNHTRHNLSKIFTTDELLDLKSVYEEVKANLS